MNESAFFHPAGHPAIGVVFRGAATRNSLLAGCVVLLLGVAILCSASLISAPRPSPADINAAAYLDLHFSYYQEHVTQTQMSNPSCH